MGSAQFKEEPGEKDPTKDTKVHTRHPDRWFALIAGCAQLGAYVKHAEGQPQWGAMQRVPEMTGVMRSLGKK